MKALFVGDNRYGPNWGGRGASLALHQLISRVFDVSGVIPGTAFVLGASELGYITALTPARYTWVFHHMRAARTKHRLFDWYVRLEELCGAKDFLSPDPAESVENLLSHKSRFPALHTLYRDTATADVLVVNGEGDMVFTTPPRREALFLLATAALGLRLGKKVFFVNSMLSDCPLTGRNLQTVAAAEQVLSRCDVVTLRDHASLEYVAQVMPEVRAELVPDSLFTWAPLYQQGGCDLPANGDFILPFPEETKYLGKLDFSRPYICVGGGALAAACPERAVGSYCQLVDKLQRLGLAVYLTKNCGRDAFLEEVGQQTGVGVVPATTPIFMAGAVLANARLFISGRYHPSILASLGGTPCIYLGTTAHKMSSLQRLLDSAEVRTFSAWPARTEIDEIVECARGLLGSGESLRRRIRSAAATRGEEAGRLSGLLGRHAGLVDSGARPAALTPPMHHHVAAIR